MYSEVQAELRERKGIDIPMTHVIMTSDETDETWWDEVRAIGWVKMDHDKLGTVERYGKWCVSFLRARIFLRPFRPFSRGSYALPLRRECDDS